MGPVGALLLAAGESRRMGTLKALLQWRDTTLLRHQVLTLQQAGLSPIVVVVGHRAPEMESHIANLFGVQTVHNPHYMEGKTTSIKAGLELLDSRDLKALLVLNVDQPRSFKTIAKVVAAHQSRHASITIPSHKGKGGHPVVFSAALLEEIKAISEDTQGLKAVVRRYESEVLRVDMDSDEVLLDLNSEAEYRRALETYGQDPQPPAKNQAR